MTDQRDVSPVANKVLNVALIGNPNTGKSTLFNALAGMNTRVGNFPGVTVEKKIGRVEWHDRSFHLIDLPGTYSLSPRSLDEKISVDVLMGDQTSIGEIDVIICIADAGNLERHFYLLSQLLELQKPVILVLNLWDTLEQRGVSVDVDSLKKRIGIPVVVTEAHRRKGMDRLKEAILNSAQQHIPYPISLFPAVFEQAVDQLKGRLEEQLETELPRYHVERMILDANGAIERSYQSRISHQLGNQHATDFQAGLQQLRDELKSQECSVPQVESQARFQWASEVLSDAVMRTPNIRTLSDKLDQLFTHRVFGLIFFLVLMFLVFQSVFTWSQPLVEYCEDAQGFVSATVEDLLPPGPLRSLLINGVIAGVGAVLVFLPLIILLFFFISILEDCGYMSRAAYMIDKIMSWFGLSGKSFLPLMSSFACAVPGVMATRVIENRRDRFVTILIAPLMSCSARLPVYLLLIGAFIPANVKLLGGFTNLQGIVLYLMVSLGALVAVPVAWILRRTLFKGESAPFIMELPEYKIPSLRMVSVRVFDRAKAFVVRAGSLILAATILIWALGYFPASHTKLNQLETQLSKLEEKQQSVEKRMAALESNPSLSKDEHIMTRLGMEANLKELESESETLAELKSAEQSRLIEESYLGRMGKWTEPLVRPLGWDWKIGVGVIASFPAREVIIATLGTIYSLGGEVNEEDPRLPTAMKASTWPDGRPVFNIPVAVSIMVFFALCAQCVSTLLVIRRETNSWLWPTFSFCYMTLLAWVGAFLSYQIGMKLVA